MTTLLLDSALRSLGFAAAVGLVLWIFRVRDAGARLAAWTAVLYGALLLPLLIAVAPPVEVPVLHRTASQRPATMILSEARVQAEMPYVAAPVRVDWRRVALGIYLAVALGLLGRLAFGWIATRRFRRAARPVNDARFSEIRNARIAESSAVAVPITIGWLRPMVVLPETWRTWDDAKIAAVMAHELSHVRRGDYATLLLASFYRCAFWFSPLAWWLDKQLRELAEQASDDSALRATADRTHYAEVLLGFCQALQNQRGRIRWQGVAMAHSGRAERRIDRILEEGRPLSKPARWPVVAGWAMAALPALYLCGVFQPVAVAQQDPAPRAREAERHRSKSADEIRSFVIVFGDTQTMTGDSRDLEDAARLKGKYGEHFIWFRRNGKDYVIRDTATVNAAHDLLKPQNDLGEKQGTLGEQQEKLAKLQEALAERQNRVRVPVEDLTREIERLREKLKADVNDSDLAELQEMLAKMQAKIGESQARVGDAQAKIGEEQEKLGRQQAELGEQQAKLGERQAEQAEKANRQLIRLMEEAMKKGLAEPAGR
ncbi:MAG TPA: M56 family metallopeptidase [Bryobacteraceae bacterium]|nr:M56 family metallopeptidase [Bryobacteraceae bacterium]